MANFPPLKKKTKPKTLNSPGVAPGERRLCSGLPSYRGFGARGLRGCGASPDGLLRAHGALLRRLKPTFRRFRSSFHVVLGAWAKGRPVHKDIPRRNTHLYR